MSRLYVGGREMKENRLSRKGDIKVMSNRRADRKIDKILVSYLTLKL